MTSRDESRTQASEMKTLRTILQKKQDNIESEVRRSKGN